MGLQLTNSRTLCAAMTPRDAAELAAQAMADELGEGWTPDPQQLIGAGWHAVAECGGMRVAKWIRPDGEVRYTAAMQRFPTRVIGTGSATPLEAVAALVAGAQTAQ